MAAPTTRHFTQFLNLTAPAAPVIPPDPPVARVTTDPYRLGLSVTLADGRITRWGPDELNAQDVPTGLSFGTSIPGGFKDMTCELLRRLDVDYPDEALFSTVRVYGPGNETVWEGRMAQFPRQHGDQFSVNPGAIGWSAHLQDDPSFREIYIDRDLSRWNNPPSTDRLILMTAIPWNTVNGNSVKPNPFSGLPVFASTLTGAWSQSSVTQGWYDAAGIQIGLVWYQYFTNGNINAAANEWFWAIYTSSDDVLAAYDTTSDLQALGLTVNPGAYLTASANRVFAVVHLGYSGAGGGGETQYELYWRFAVYGRHGLTRRAGLAGGPDGFYASDVIADIVSRAAPLITYTTGSEGSIQPTSFTIPNLTFFEPTTASDAIALVTAYHGYEWGVYEGRQFFWRPADPNRLTWEARLSDGAQVSLEGDDANNVFNGVIVTYSDPSGQKRIAGPPGSGSHTEDASLEDTDPDNPVNKFRIPKRWGKLDLSVTTTTQGAIQLGAIWLNEHKLPTRRGQLTLTGHVQHPTQGKRPVWQVRAGDYIRIADRPNDPVRRIIETRYDHDTRQLTASLDQTVFKLEAIMERLGVGIVGVI